MAWHELDDLKVCVAELSFMNGLVVGGSLMLAGTSVTEFPNDLEVVSLDISNTLISKLPYNLVLRGNLFLSHSKVTIVPDGLVIPGVLWVDGLGMTSIPPNVIVKGAVYGLV